MLESSSQTQTLSSLCLECFPYPVPCPNRSCSDADYLHSVFASFPFFVLVLNFSLAACKFISHCFKLETW